MDYQHKQFGPPDDKESLVIKNGQDQSKSVNLIYYCFNYLSSSSNSTIRIKKVQKTSQFEYSETSEASKIKVKLSNTEISSFQADDSETFEVIFPDNIEEGTYRIVFELYDAYGTKYTESFVNFIVLDN